MDLISIIVPVYNVEKYIHRCIDSVINQTYKNLEIILIDDGSPDNCGKICDEYALKDSRVKVIHKKNGGLSEARNFGIDAATGEWLTFLDSDDWLHEQTLEKLYKAVVKNGVYVSICGYSETAGNNPDVDISFNAELWSPKDLYLKKHINSTIACGKLYHKKCFESIRYPVGKIHEDEFVTYRILFEQEKIAFIDQPYYAYFVNPEGITKSEWSLQRLAALDALEEQLSFFNGLGDNELFEFSKDLYLAILHRNHKKARSENYKKECFLLTNKFNNVVLKDPKHFFNEKNIWLLEYFHPRLMRCYWLAKAAIGKIFKK